MGQLVPLHVGLTTACLYNCGCCFFLYYWRQYKLARLKEEGKLTHIKTVDELLDAVDNLQNQAAKSSLMIAGEAVEARRRGLSAKTLPGPEEKNALLDSEKNRAPPSKALPIRGSALRSQSSLLSNDPTPSLGFGGSFAGGSGYFSQAANSPQPRLGFAPASIRFGPSQIWGDRGPPARRDDA
jgi:hypothetical protein